MRFFFLLISLLPIVAQAQLIQSTSNIKVTTVETKPAPKKKKQAKDLDGDKYYDPATVQDVNRIQKGYVDVATCLGIDCDDNNSSIHAPQPYFVDGDLDSYGSTSVVYICSLTPPQGYSLTNDDCNDDNSNIHPNATEICNAQDDNCNNITDDNLPLTMYFIDENGDGYAADSSSAVLKCMQPAGYVTQVVPKNSLRINSTGVKVNQSLNGASQEYIFVNEKEPVFNNPLTPNSVTFENVANLSDSLINYPGAIACRNMLVKENFKPLGNNGYSIPCPTGIPNACANIKYDSVFAKVSVEWVDRMKISRYHLIAPSQYFDEGMKWFTKYLNGHYKYFYFQAGQEQNLSYSDACCTVCGNGDKVRDSTNKIFSWVKTNCPKAKLIADFDPKPLKSDEDLNKSTFNKKMKDVPLADAFRYYCNGEPPLYDPTKNLPPSAYIDSVDIGVNVRLPLQIGRINNFTGKAAAITSWCSDGAGNPAAGTIVQADFCMQFPNKVLMMYAADTTSILLCEQWRYDPQDCRTTKASKNLQYLMAQWNGELFKGQRTIYDMVGETNAGCTADSEGHGTINVTNMSDKQIPIGGILVDGKYRKIVCIQNYHPINGDPNSKGLTIDTTTDYLLQWSVCQITF